MSHKHLDQSGVMKPLMAATEGDMMLPTGYITSSLGMHGLGPDGIIGNISMGILSVYKD